MTGSAANYVFLTMPESEFGTSATLGHVRVESEARRITDIRTFAPAEF
jgi:hypothetical protein